MTLREEIAQCVHYQRDRPCSDGDFVRLSDVLAIFDSYTANYKPILTYGAVDDKQAAKPSEKKELDIAHEHARHIVEINPPSYVRALKEGLAVIDAPPSEERPALKDLLYLSGQRWASEDAAIEVHAKGCAAIVEAIDALTAEMAR